MKQEKILESFAKIFGKKKSALDNLSEKEKAERLDSIKQTQKEIQINQSKDKKKLFPPRCFMEKRDVMQYSPLISSYKKVIYE